jgi:hypothetical protein
MTKTHLIALVAVLLLSAQTKAGDSSPNASNLATIFDPNVTSCSVEKARTLPYVARVELKVSETASRQYVFFENGEGIVTLEDGTTALLSLKETAAFFGYSEDDFKRDPVLHIRTTAESWTGIIGLFNITAAIDPGLLDLIDQKASLYFNPSWNLNINQFKAWLATIAWAEGGLGGYGAHSQYGGGYNGDAFNHIVVGGSFRFSTGIGPFQLDRGSSENWGLLRTGQKLDPQLAVESAARWHRDNRGSGSTLSNFANNSPWVGVRTPDAYWSVVTGTAWSAHSGGNASLDWSGIRNQLGANAAGYPYLSYSNNVVDRGYLTWNIKSGANLLTESGRPVIFDGNYQTWLVTARPWGGQPEVCKYYYTYRTDGTYPIEVWVWDNNWDTNNKFKYIFARECNGQFPEWRSGSSAGYPALSQPAIIIGGQKSDLTIVEPVVVSPASVAPGGTIRVDWTEKNIGASASSPAHNTKIFLSTSAYGTTYQVGYYGPMNTLGVGATQSYYDPAIVVPTSVPAGDYYVTVYIDCDSQVSEENENNNIGSSSPNRVTVITGQTLSVSLTAQPSSGTAPLGVDLTADVSGTATGTINYTFWWNCNDPSTSVSYVSSVCGDPWNSTYGAKFDGVWDDPKTVNHTYSTPGTYSAKVIAERGTALPVEQRITITVNAPPPAISVTPASRDFGSVQVGSYADGTFTVQNTGGGTLSGSASTSAPFSIVSGGTYNLSAGQSQTVTVRFSPTAAQNYNGTVTFTGGGGATRPVSGTGYTPPAISVTPSSRDFGSVQVGSYADLTFTVQNTGGGTLTGGASVSSPFSIISGGSYSLTAGQSQVVTVRFSPPAVQSYSQNVTFTGGGGATRPVSGSGYNPPAISVTPSSRDFGSVQVGSYADLTFTVQNTGGGTLSGNTSTSAPFSIVSGGTYNLSAGQSQTVTVRFSPTAAQSYNETVTFTGGGGATRPVSGTGLLQKYTITATFGENGTVEPNSVFDVNLGQDVTFTAEPNTGYIVDWWYLDGSEVQQGSTTYTLYNVQADHNVLVTFIEISPMDLNNDGIVNFSDFAIFAFYWMDDTCSEPDWCEGSDSDYSGRVDFVDLLNFVDYWLWCRADLDLDGAVNFSDYAIFAYNWMDDTCCDPNWCEGTDFDHSGSVDMLDLATFARYWLEGI